MTRHVGELSFLESSSKGSWVMDMAGILLLGLKEDRGCRQFHQTNKELLPSLALPIFLL